MFLNVRSVISTCQIGLLDKILTKGGQASILELRMTFGGKKKKRNQNFIPEPHMKETLWYREGKDGM